MPNLTRRNVLVALGAAALTPRSWAQDASDIFNGFPNTRIRFASQAAGRAVLMADDDYLDATSGFLRRAIMGSATPVTLDAFRRWNGDAALAWSTDRRERWRKALQVLAPAFSALRIPLPAEVLLVASNGQEMANAPYTRANAVVLPDAKFRGYADATVLAHELWHIASRHAPALATRLYAEIGFEPMPELVFPAAWAEARIANPDALDNRHAMRISIGGRTALVAPVLVASRTVLNQGETFFNVIEPRLLEVERYPSGTATRAVRQGGQLLWHALNGPHDYLRRLGGNTGYVLHPEETMADNVALLAAGIAPRNPELLARIRAVLA
jgi:hypothetical protein